eukprot:2738788-Lingulodinium_polyedra.AAC.1
MNEARRAATGRCRPRSTACPRLPRARACPACPRWTRRGNPTRPATTPPRPAATGRPPGQPR